ncbi:recombinase family protein [Novosphingobium sp. AAP83]|uniref:recombinase family protein n=1 Tax=Novosphingobium sp. AAP83 TaxID=1523425 RepID=UPI0009E6D7A6|nr:recombinase family protein [Novosphingobium sp. AAP83]
MSRIAYYRCSTGDQSIESQRNALSGDFEREFSDAGVSGAVLAEDRHGFSDLLKYIREGDTLCIYDISRLGRDALNVQSMVRRLLAMGVTIEVLGLGAIGKGVGELIVAVLSQIADMERQRIWERCDAGRAAAKVSLKATGLTHRGKVSLGRPMAADAAAVVEWRRMNAASIRQTCAHFGISKATVTRYCGNANAA